MVTIQGAICPPPSPGALSFNTWGGSLQCPLREAQPSRQQRIPLGIQKPLQAPLGQQCLIQRATVAS